ncbi:hypothetical protein B0H14DRAFT_2639116 [Mycena olivaceomarginata]|nr:hypothetical protein B0H14DRAFT_2639116 [Mycena olivaceomarginata]
MAPSNNSYEPLNISIVGAGIGGLTAAVALRRNGHNVQSVVFPSNGSERAQPPLWFLTGTSLPSERSVRGLKRLATGEGEGPPAILRLGTTVVSSILKKVSNLMNMPELEWLHAGVTGVALSSIGKGHSEYSPEDEAGWTPIATREEFIAKFPKFHPKFMHFLDLPIHGSIHRWRLRVLPHLPTWVRGRAALLGDAAHGTLPLLGQGAGMAIEDGGSLGFLLPAGTRREDIPARLEAYQRLRTERGEFVNTESVAQLSKGFNLVKAKEIQSYLFEYDAMGAAEKCYRDHFGTGGA